MVFKKGHKTNVGRKRPEEYKISLSNKTKGIVNKGKHLSPQTEFKKGQMSGENHPLWGKEVSEETRKKKSDSMKEYFKTHTSSRKGKPAYNRGKFKIHTEEEIKAKKEKRAAYAKKYNILNKEKRNTASKAYYETHKDEKRVWGKKYYQDNKGKVSVRQKINGKIYQKSHKEEIHIRNKMWRKTPQGRISGNKCKAKRRREYECEPMNLRFDYSHSHHLDYKNVIYVPNNLHNSIRHNQKDEESMTRINILAWAFLEASVL